MLIHHLISSQITWIWDIGLAEVKGQKDQSMQVKVQEWPQIHISLHFIISIEYSQIQMTTNRQIWPSTRWKLGKMNILRCHPHLIKPLPSSPLDQTLRKSTFAVPPVCTYDHRLRRNHASQQYNWSTLVSRIYISHNSLHSCSNRARKKGWKSQHTQTHATIFMIWHHKSTRYRKTLYNEKRHKDLLF